MALGTPAVVTGTAIIGSDPGKPVWPRLITVTGESAYVTGGTDLATLLAALSDFKGHTTLTGMQVESSNERYRGIYKRASGKLLVWDHQTGAEVIATTNLSGVTFTLVIWTY